MAKSATIKDTDKGWKRIASELRTLQTKSINIGVLGDSADHPSGINMAMIATWNEFGTRTAPARSFMRSTFDEKLKSYERLIGNNLNRLGTGTTAEILLAVLGEKMKGDIQRKIVTLKEPPNSEATIANKKSSNPLIDTGRMRQSIDYEVK
jgi:hypothetical protein